MRVVTFVSMVVAAALIAAGCAGPAATTAAPTQAPPTTAPTQAPPTAAPTQAPPTAVPTQAPPTAAPTATAPSEKVVFNWAPGSVPPSDADDVDIIASELYKTAGITSVTGNEQVLNVFYNPTVITVEEIMELLKTIGHPVVINE